jgi:hypothetical protein
MGGCQETRHDSSHQRKQANNNLHSRRAAVRDCGVTGGLEALQVIPVSLIGMLVVVTCDRFLLCLCVLLSVSRLLLLLLEELVLQQQLLRKQRRWHLRRELHGKSVYRRRQRRQWWETLIVSRLLLTHTLFVPSMTRLLLLSRPLLPGFLPCGALQLLLLHSMCVCYLADSLLSMRLLLCLHYLCFNARKCCAQSLAVRIKSCVREITEKSKKNLSVCVQKP